MTIRGIVQNHSIALPPDLELPDGTEVDITVLAPEPDTDEAPTAIVDDVPTVRGKPHILVVDDMEPLRELAEFVLLDAGYRVSLTESSDEALALLENDRTVSLVVTDLDLPGRFTGLDMARYLKINQPDVSVLLTSGYAADITPEGELHGFPFLPKTAWSDQLTEKVKACLAGKAPVK